MIKLPFFIGMYVSRIWIHIHSRIKTLVVAYIKEFFLDLLMNFSSSGRRGLKLWLCGFFGGVDYDFNIILSIRVMIVEELVI